MESRPLITGCFLGCTAAALAVWFAILAAAPLSASTWKGRELRQKYREAPLKLGPFRIQPAFMLSNAGYDSNVYYRPEAVADYWLTAGPAFDIYLPVKKKFLVHVFESPQYVYFFKTKSERTWNNYLNADANFLFNRFLVSAGGALNDARERWSSEIDYRPRRKEEAWFGSLLWQASGKTSLTVGLRRVRYSYESILFEDIDLQERLDREEVYAGATVFYQAGSRMRIFLEGEYGVFDFKNPANPGDSWSRAAFAGVEFSPFGRVRGRIRLGFKEFDIREAGRPGFRGIVGDSSVSIRLLKAFSVRGSYRRDVRFSVWSGNFFYIEDWAGLGSSLYLLRRKIRLDFDYGQGLNSYPSASLDENPWPGRRKDRFLVRSAGLYFRLKGDVGLGLTAGMFRRTINIYGWDTERKFASLNLTYEF
jgi:hypothetical protein